jgi:FKBP-type peptidyl-prolyl cis-trans isomerase
MRIGLLPWFVPALAGLAMASQPTPALAQGAPPAAQIRDAKAQAADFFAQLKHNPHVVTTHSGLRYEILKQGHGRYPRATDIVRVNYSGTLIDGSVFDSTFQPRTPGAAPKPVEFELDQVIDGWTEGIQRINQGGTIKLYIPADLAYGDQARPHIPPGSALIFQIDLLDIKRP